MSFNFKILPVVLMMTACDSGVEKRVNESEGIISARARNTLVERDPVSLVRVGEGFERSGNFNSAMALYQQALAASPQLVEAHIAVGRIFAARGNIDAAMAMFLDLQKRYPGSHEITRTYAKILSGAGKYQLAKQQIDMIPAVSLNIEDKILAAKLAEISGNGSEAKSILQKTSETNPARYDVKGLLALSFALDGAYETAVELLQEGLSSPIYAGASRMHLAQVYALSGQAEAAELIAKESMGEERAAKLRFFFKSLPVMSRQEKAQALYFDQIPVDLLDRLRAN